MVQPQWHILRSEVFAGVDVVVHVTMRANGAGWSGYLQALEVSGETSAAGDLSLLVAKLLQLLADPMLRSPCVRLGGNWPARSTAATASLTCQTTRWFSFNVGLEFSWPRRCSRRRDRAQGVAPARAEVCYLAIVGQHAVFDQEIERSLAEVVDVTGAPILPAGGDCDCNWTRDRLRALRP